MGPRTDGTMVITKGGEIQPAPEPSEMSLIRLAVERGAPIETIERLVALQEKMLARKAETEFNNAMNAAQAEIKKIIAKSKNNQTNSNFASYDELDEPIRPIYIKHGFSLSFDSGDCPSPNKVRVFCFVSHIGGHTRKYQAPDMPLPTVGPKGQPVMTETHGTGAAMSYSMRYLLVYIFNIPIKKDDKDGNGSMMPENQERDFLLAINEAHSLEELGVAYKAAIKTAVGMKDYNGCSVFEQARTKREKELRQ